MDFGKFIRFIATGMLVGLSMTFAYGADDDCKGRENDPDPAPGGGAADPVFFFMDKVPVATLVYRQSELQMAANAQFGEKAFRPDESQLLSQYEEAVKSDRKSAYSSALKLWGDDLSADLKRYVLLLGIGSVTDTEQKNDLRFLLASLDDTASSKTELNRMAMSNGLERRKAARLLTLMMANPAMQVAQE